MTASRTTLAVRSLAVILAWWQAAAWTADTARSAEPWIVTTSAGADLATDASPGGANGLAALTFCDVAVSRRPAAGTPRVAAPPRPKLRIINGTDHAVDVFWLESDTRRVPNGSIPPGKDTTITTTLGHRFVIVDREDGSESTVTSEVPVQAFRVGGVPGFYTQRSDAHSFPIVASANVNPFALAEAAYLADLMLAKRPDVREAMIKSGARLSIIAWNEFTTDQPEWKWLAETPVAGFRDIAARDYYDARARGMGGSETDPYCSCAEENLLCYPGDPYSTECILIHEFAHNIHLRGMVNVDPTFDARLRAAYDTAMREGLWRGKYASVNHHEYFAEGVQSWFDNNREHDHDHNHVDTRAELNDYDPRLAALCREVFGDTELRYTKPQTRLAGHLAGYDPATAPRFEWPERLAKPREEIRLRARARDAEANAAPGASAPGSSSGAESAVDAQPRKPNSVVIYAADLGYGGGPTTRGFDRYFGTDVPIRPPCCFIEDDRTVGIPGEFLPARLLRDDQATKQGPALAGWTLEPILPALLGKPITDGRSTPGGPQKNDVEVRARETR